MPAWVFVPFYLLALLALPIASIALAAIIGRMALASYEARPNATLVIWSVVFIVGFACAAGSIYAAVEGY